MTIDDALMTDCDEKVLILVVGGLYVVGLGVGGLLGHFAFLPVGVRLWFMAFLSLACLSARVVR